MTTLLEARDFLLAHRDDLDAARAGFRWPEPERFNWALEWFDGVLAADPAVRDRPALRIVDCATDTETSISFAELSERSSRLANTLRGLGLGRGDRLLLLMGNEPLLWEVMLAAFKLGVVVIPATLLLTASELADRIARGGVKAVVTEAGQCEKWTRRASPVCASSPGRRSGAAGRRSTAAGRRPRTSSRTGRRAATIPASLLHLRNDGEAEARSAHAQDLSDRRADDDVLARASAGRRASQRFFAGLGEARLEFLLRPLERGCLRPHHQPGALRCEGASRRDRQGRSDDALRTPDGLAPHRAGGPAERPARLARALRSRRAAQPGGDRAGACRLGTSHPRRLRPDRNHRDGRERAGARNRIGFDGTAATGIRDRDPRRRRPAFDGGRGLRAARRRAPRRSHGRISSRRRNAVGRGRGRLSHGGRRLPRRRRRPDLRRSIRTTSSSRRTTGSALSSSKAS